MFKNHNDTPSQSFQTASLMKESEMKNLTGNHEHKIGHEHKVGCQHYEGTENKEKLGDFA